MFYFIYSTIYYLVIIEYDKYNINLVYPYIYIFTLEDDYSFSLYFHFNVNNNFNLQFNCGRYYFKCYGNGLR